MTNFEGRPSLRAEARADAPTFAERTAFVAHYCPAIAQVPNEKAAGHPIPTPQGVQDAFNTCQEQVARTFHVLVTYQPASHYWPFQWLEPE